jgi:pimeloyl-ACP methyl ester carboxylesterase
LWDPGEGKGNHPRTIRWHKSWRLPGGGVYAVFPPSRYRPQRVRALVTALTDYVRSEPCPPAGLGSSEEEFANTNFSSNVEDLVRAAAYLRDKYAAPSILICHSLGGAAVLAAAQDVPEARAVVTIGAPADIAHVPMVTPLRGDLILRHVPSCRHPTAARVHFRDRPEWGLSATRDVCVRARNRVYCAPHSRANPFARRGRKASDLNRSDGIGP